jgi:hypothetical protein
MRLPHRSQKALSPGIELPQTGQRRFPTVVSLIVRPNLAMFWKLWARQITNHRGISELGGTSEKISAAL